MTVSFLQGCMTSTADGGLVTTRALVNEQKFLSSAKNETELDKIAALAPNDGN
jgi:hypothetical protein